jgi:hypothetical protein
VRDLVRISFHGGLLVSVDEAATVAAVQGRAVEHDGVFDVVARVAHHSHDRILTYVQNDRNTKIEYNKNIAVEIKNVGTCPRCDCSKNNQKINDVIDGISKGKQQKSRPSIPFRKAYCDTG